MSPFLRRPPGGVVVIFRRELVALAEMIDGRPPDGLAPGVAPPGHYTMSRHVLGLVEAALAGRPVDRIDAAEILEGLGTMAHWWITREGEDPFAVERKAGSEIMRRLALGEPVETMGQRIRRIRARAALTQETVAKELGVSVRTVKRWERDKSPPSSSHRVGLRALFADCDDVAVGASVPPAATFGPTIWYVGLETAAASASKAAITDSELTSIAATTRALMAEDQTVRPYPPGPGAFGESMLGLLDHWQDGSATPIEVASGVRFLPQVIVWRDAVYGPKAEVEAVMAWWADLLARMARDLLARGSGLAPRVVIAGPDEIGRAARR